MSRRRHHADPPALTPELTSFTEWSRHLEAGISSLATTPVSLVMRRDAPCIDENATEEMLIELLVAHGVDGVTVVDHAQLLVGFVSSTDLVRPHEAAPGLRTVRDLMTAVVVDILETASLAKASLLMARHKVQQLPVVTDNGRVVGLITATTVLRWLYEHRATTPDAGRRAIH